jgi:AbrB family looped-hinge helix DNA binding protein
MSVGLRATVTVSTRGGFVLPKAIRDAKNWRAGQKLLVEATGEGVLLRPEKPFAPKNTADVFGSLVYQGKRLTDQDVETRLIAAMRRRVKNKDF